MSNMSISRYSNSDFCNQLVDELGSITSMWMRIIIFLITVCVYYFLFKGAYSVCVSFFFSSSVEWFLSCSLRK